jgi:hypothetical protein
MFGVNHFFQTLRKFDSFSFSTNLSFRKKALPKKDVFLAQVLSLERKCFGKKKKCCVICGYKKGE